MFMLEFFPDEYQSSQNLFNKALADGQCEIYSFDVFGKRLIECPVTPINEHGEHEMILRKHKYLTHISTLLYKLADYFQNQMHFDF